MSRLRGYTCILLLRSCVCVCVPYTKKIVIPRESFISFYRIRVVVISSRDDLGQNRRNILYDHHHHRVHPSSRNGARRTRLYRIIKIIRISPPVSTRRRWFCSCCCYTMWYGNNNNNNICNYRASWRRFKTAIKFVTTASGGTHTLFTRQNICCVLLYGGRSDIAAPSLWRGG